MSKAISYGPLPRHVVEIQTDQIDTTSKYFDGRYAQGHGRSYYDDERYVSSLRTMLRLALDALRKWDGDVLPLKAANDLKIVYAVLDEVTSHMPQLMAWCCWTEYLPDANGKRWSDAHVVWSAHLTEEEAKRWLPYWQEKFKDSKDYGWHMELHPCDIGLVKEPGMDPGGFV